MPRKILGEPSHQKQAKPGDWIVMTGGRIGKDGIHGATFSSEELHEESPTSAVQIGDPITQKRMTDFLLAGQGPRALRRDYGQRRRRALLLGGRDGPGLQRLRAASGKGPAQVCRAGPLGNSSLRSPGAHDPGRPSGRALNRFLELAGKMEVEATVLGKFTDSGQIPYSLRGPDGRLYRHGFPARRLPADGAPGQVGNEKIPRALLPRAPGSYGGSA